IDVDGNDTETENLVYALALYLLPRSRAALQLHTSRDVNDVATDAFGSRRLVTESNQAKWTLLPWRAGRLILSWQGMKAEDELDPGGYSRDTERYGADFMQSSSFGILRTDYEVKELAVSSSFVNRREELDVRFDTPTGRDSRLAAEYRYRDYDRALGGDSEVHTGRIRAEHRKSDHIRATLDLRGTLASTDSSEISDLSALADLTYYPVREEERIWKLDLGGRYQLGESETFAPTPSSTERDGSAISLSAEHTTGTPRFRLQENYGLQYHQAESSGSERDEVQEGAGIRLNFRPSRSWTLEANAGLGLRQREQSGVSDDITEANVGGDVIVDVTRRFRTHAKIASFLTNEPDRPSPVTRSRIDGEWTIHDHRWDWGSDRFVARFDTRGQDGNWSRSLGLSYNYNAQFTELSLTTLVVRQAWYYDDLAERSLTEVRLGFRYDINQLMMRLEYVHREADGGLGVDRNYLLVKVRRTF
ncbi:MAG: hypothetical protein ACYTFI_23005, partial [Planctomycetota bacterium]